MKEFVNFLNRNRRAFLLGVGGDRLILITVFLEDAFKRENFYIVETAHSTIHMLWGVSFEDALRLLLLHILRLLLSDLIVLWLTFHSTFLVVA